MKIIILHDTETEEIMGMVYLVDAKIAFNEFFEEIWESWTQFNKINSEMLQNEEGYSVQDFVKFHNENNEMKIAEPESDEIQLRFRVSC